MSLRSCLLPLFAGLLAVGIAQAQTAPAAAAGDATPSPAQQADTAPASAAPAAPTASPATRPASGNPDRRVIEDDQVRIEELRVRGQLRRVTVQSKLEGAREYEIIVGHGGRDPSQDRGNAGRSAWRIFGF